MNRATAIRVAGGAVLVVFLGWGGTWFVHWWFGWGSVGWGATRRGVVGDSFGAVNALFAGLAFIGVAVAVVIQRDQLEEQRAETRASELERTKEVRFRQRAAFEATFFQLLSSFQAIVEATRVGEWQGRQAIRKLAERLAQTTVLRTLITDPNPTREMIRESMAPWYERFYHGGREIAAQNLPYAEGADDLLGHYFRLLYNIIKFVDSETAVDVEQKRFYIRVLRAHLSDPELVLIFYNGLSKFGYRKFYPLIEQYDLLQNIDFGSLVRGTDRDLYPSLSPLRQQGEKAG